MVAFADYPMDTVAMVSPINAAERKPYQKIADQLRTYIVQEDFKAGSRLPPSAI